MLQTLFSPEVSDRARCPFGRRLAPPSLVHGQAVERAVKDGAGKRGARLRLDAVLEAAEDGHVAGLQVRRALWREEAQHDVRESGPHGCQCGLAGVDAGHVPEEDPRLSLSALIEHVIQSGRELQDRGRRGPAVLLSDVVSALRPGLFGQVGVCLACTICTSMSSGPGFMLKATVNVVASFVLPCSWACFVPRPHLV